MQSGLFHHAGLRCDEYATPLLGNDKPFGAQLTQCLTNCHAGDAEVRNQLAFRGNGIPRLQPAGEYRLSHSSSDLRVGGGFQ